jgi:hypothetical protein
MADKIKAVEIRAEVRQIKTMADHSVNLILNVPEDCREQVKAILDWQGLEVTAVLAVSDESENGSNG